MVPYGGPDGVYSTRPSCLRSSGMVAVSQPQASRRLFASAAVLTVAAGIGVAALFGAFGGSESLPHHPSPPPANVAAGRVTVPNVLGETLPRAETELAMTGLASVFNPNVEAALGQPIVRSSLRSRRLLALISRQTPQSSSPSPHRGLLENET
jgi:hypothetical protein